MSEPRIDSSDAADVLRDLEAKLPGYTPEWTADEEGIGHTLLRVMARYRSILNKGLNRVPELAQLAFLDFLGQQLAPASAARVPLVFKISEDARLDVTLPEGSQVAASVTPVVEPNDVNETKQAKEAEPTVFATERAITLCRGRIACLYSIEPGADRYAEHTDNLLSGFTLFDNFESVEHAIYIGHDLLFNLGGEITLLIGISLERFARERVDLRWEYLTETGWIPLQSLKEEDTTGGLVASGQITLRHACGPDAKEESFAGRKSYWIRAVSRTSVLPGGGVTELFVNELNVRAKFGKSGLLPDVAFADFVNLDTSKDFYPFGQTPVRSSTFYFTCKDAFQRSGAQVHIKFVLSSNGLAGAGLAWEYSSSQGWVELDVTPDDFDFSGDGSVSFACPTDWSEMEVNGNEQRWLRVRIIEEYGFGEPDHFDFPTVATTLPPPPPVFVEGHLKVPEVKQLTISFEYITDPESLDHCLSYNNFSFADHSEACRWPDQSFSPFRPISDPAPAVHYGFDQALPRGLASIFVQVPENESRALPATPYIWEYRAEDAWKELDMIDETRGFRQSGMLQFVCPSDAVATEGVGEGKLYRLRALLKQGEAQVSVPVGGVWLNAAWARHQRGIERELLGVSDGNPGQTMRFVRAPVLQSETIEVQEWTGRGDVWRSAIEGVDENELRVEKDPVSGAPTAVWVRWNERPHLHDSTKNDRHYTIERSTGILRFGCKVPAAGRRVMVSYRTGGGLAGNVPIHSVTELRIAAAYLAGVDNPISAQGGADSEPLSEVHERGAQRLRHRDRALSKQDYEWLARDASPEVARARCRPLLGPDGHAQRGWVTLMVVAESRAPRPIPSAELARRVRAYVEMHASAAVSVRVLAPEYVAVGVVAAVTPKNPGDAANIEHAVRKALQRFLHPLDGGPLGRGWDFGEAVHLSQVAKQIEAVDGIDYATSIRLKIGDTVYDSMAPVPEHGLVVSGSHELLIQVGVN